MSNIYGRMQHVKFTDIFDSFDTFKSHYESCRIPQMVTNDSLEAIYYLLYANYGNSTIANLDTNQFEYKCFSLIFQHGPTWEKKSQIQKLIQDTDIEEFNEGTRSINNRAYNPGNEQLSSQDEILTINEQNTASVKRGKLETYQYVLDLLDENFTMIFLNYFKTLFTSVVEPNAQLLYYTEEE